MKTFIHLSLIFLCTHFAYGQKEKVFIIKIHPFAYLINDMNVCIEAGTSKKIRYTASIFKTQFYPGQFASSFGNENIFDHYEEKTKGFTLRSGVRVYNMKGFFLEPQFRFAKTTTIETSLSLKDNSLIYEIAAKRTTSQFCLLSGWQYKSSNHPFIFDTYLGIGAINTRFNDVTMANNIDKSKIGQKINRDNQKETKLNLYLGISVGINLYNIKSLRNNPKRQ